MLIAAHTLGCKLNFAETSAIVRRFTDAGHTLVDFHERADLYIVNTCTVTAVAEKKCRNAIRQAVAQNPLATVAVVGCFAQNAADQILSIPGVKIVLGNDKKHLLYEILTSDGSQFLPIVDEPRSFKPLFSTGDRTRVFFKIQDGCDYFCTYCAIPFARGRSRSASIDETLAVARQIAETGAKEVVLTGVNTGTFGQHNNERLIDLLRRLDEVEGILRYRISSIEPNLLTNEVVDFVASSRAFLPHFHIPLQAGSDHVLAMMHRRYTTADFAEKLAYVRSKMPEACIAADIMAGFNGESEEEFDKVCRYVEELPISYLHVFTYSERPNTAALKLGEKVPMATRRAHSQILHTISERKRAAFVASQIGTERPVLWESTRHGDTMQGWTDNYIRLCQPYNPLAVNTITTVKLSPANVVEQHTDEA
ncbi:MAG: tRNA (N(6)-L-threonylcarbamoyladenosine(37)-C(2))-methylthiotransferase MtaB [Bacteroidales bacterium]|nr:tRNA (N(6)-L-threonylcarbamoyladenosine(37)-C(2))-methylthiotransferase MtaB [Bacteroidales bacterium]